MPSTIEVLKKYKVLSASVCRVLSRLGLPDRIGPFESILTKAVAYAVESAAIHGPETFRHLVSRAVDDIVKLTYAFLEENEESEDALQDS